ncbi:glycerophosphodiester phosphodiesterase family protein [Hymenobacter sp. BRD67]|uniref:glycerophosphodiester phosphodiesterase family protein n=1 Tax=Hymenobacter sp. BRD67 TaxID=2675877 RepID=UPI00156308E7|nr:glycerophosphodiester phosphodiesterase family protein [Hymenobacter sp. BRD67]QKG54102.1 glycerophosphodiester phosphodiesterase [Hymenobacter sp. BRD67]
MQFPPYPGTLAGAAFLEVHGHRGCRGLLPENTLPAFLHALELGVDVLELDVVISHDNQVVVSHEPWLSASLGSGPAGEAIDPRHPQQFNLYKLPYATIRECRVGEKPHPDFPFQQPVPAYRPLLREVFEAVELACHRLQRPPVGYSIEVKSSLAGDDIFHPRPATFVDLVVAELVTAQLLSRTTLLSFDPRVLQYARQAAPLLRQCLLVERPAPSLPVCLQQLGFIPDTLGPDFTLLSKAMVHELRRAYAGLRLVPWTVNDVSDLRRVASWGVDGITTDYPNRLLQLLGRV